MGNSGGTDNMNNISIKTIVAEIINRKFIVIAIVAASVLISFFYTKVILKPSYTACSKLVVIEAGNEQLNVNDFSSAYYLIRDYKEIVVDSVVLDEVIEELELNCSYSQLKNSVLVENPSNSRILEIYVTTESARESKTIADKVCEVSKEKITEVLGVDRVSVMSWAHMPSLPSTPDLAHNLWIGLCMGLFVSALVLFLLYFFDDKIKGEADVKRYLNISVLATIPFNKTRAHDSKSTVKR